MWPYDISTETLFYTESRYTIIQSIVGGVKSITLELQKNDIETFLIFMKGVSLSSTLLLTIWVYEQYLLLYFVM